MVIIRVKAKIVEDNTGLKSLLPILITEQGELSPLTDYLLYLETLGKSRSTMDRVIRVTTKLLQYMDANKDVFDDPKHLFQTFAKRMYTGTIGDDGLDPSGLYWIPTSVQETAMLITALTGFTDWLEDHLGATNANPLRKASRHEERLIYAAWHRRNQHDFLGHIQNDRISYAAKKARLIKGRTPLSKVESDAIAFPESHWENFFFQGMGGAKDSRVALRDQLIVLLLHAGGLRISEALLLWVTDVFEDPNNPSKAVVRIFDEVDGKAPFGWKNRINDKTRKAYLKENFGRIPRIQEVGTAHLGFKSRVVDHADHYMQVHWFPAEYGRLFMALWRSYSRFRAVTDSHHPYAFASFSGRSFGNPYTLGAFNDNYARGLRRIGLEPNKSTGLSPHGHRHSFARRLVRAGLDPFVVRKCLHHKSLESQVTYTQLGIDEISNILSEATEKIASPNKKKEHTGWKSLVERGFEDIDPQGLFTGNHPKLGEK